MIFKLIFKIRIWGDAGLMDRTELAARLLPRLVDWYEENTGIQFPLEKIGINPFKIPDNNKFL